MIAGWISGEDLKEPEAVSVRDWRELGEPLVASGTGSVLWRMFAMSRVAVLLLWLGPAKLVRRNSIYIPK